MSCRLRKWRLSPLNCKPLTAVSLSVFLRHEFRKCRIADGDEAARNSQSSRVRDLFSFVHMQLDWQTQSGALLNLGTKLDGEAIFSSQTFRTNLI